MIGSEMHQPYAPQQLFADTAALDCRIRRNDLGIRQLNPQTTFSFGQSGQSRKAWGKTEITVWGIIIHSNEQIGKRVEILQLMAERCGMEGLWHYSISATRNGDPEDPQEILDTMFEAVNSPTAENSPDTACAPDLTEI